MTDVLMERFAAVANPRNDADWVDVQRRARRGRARKPLLALIAVIVTVAVAAPAFGLHRAVVDFLSMDHAPEQVQLMFSEVAMFGPPGLGPDLAPNSARKVMDVSVDGKSRPVFVALTRDGGFCVRSSFAMWCRYRTPPAGRRAWQEGELKPYVLGAHGAFDESGVAQTVGGTIVEHDVDVLVAEFADGSSRKLRVRWVSRPVDAGFYFLDLPDEHRRRGMHLVRLVARNARGDVLALQSFRPPKSGGRSFPSLPRNVVVTHPRLVLSIATAAGRSGFLFIRPAIDPNECHVWDRGAACPAVGWSNDVKMAAGLEGGRRPVLFTARVVWPITWIDLRYEDGTRTRLATGHDGVLRAEVGPAHYPRGHRLVSAVALDVSGRIVERQSFEPTIPGVYPCDRRIAIGRGVLACP